MQRMSKPKHTYEEIMTYLKSAAENAYCETCEFQNCDGCLEYICGEAYELIKQQKSEIERLQKNATH